MKLSDFSFDFPEDLVAQSPLSERDQSRLFIWDGRCQNDRDSRFSQVSDELRSLFAERGQVPILLIVNDSKVYPARVRIQRASGARGEVFVLSPDREKDISCLLRPLKKLKVGEVLLSEHDQRALFQVTSVNPPRVDNVSGKPIFEILNHAGEMPLPPYIVRDPARVNDPSISAMDRLRYQTVYAREVGSAAAPTAGLHFTPSVLNDCAEKNIHIAGVTLHVGLGTFQPVTTDKIDEHEMHTEICSIPRSTMIKVIEHVRNHWPIVFVGTTSLRTVESVLLRGLGYDISQACTASRKTLAERMNEGSLVPETLMQMADQWIETDLFIRPANPSQVYRPLCGDGMITNFHQPESTLAMLIAALLGYSNWRSVYQKAIERRYRLFSYGDSSLLLFPGGS